MKLVPVIFAHVCCSRGYIFGQGPNGDNYRRRADAPGSEPWEPIVPALGVPLGATKRHRMNVQGSASKPQKQRENTVSQPRRAGQR